MIGEPQIDEVDMLERSAYNVLLDWKAQSGDKALLVDGARQIGKTFLIEHFAQREYPSFVKIDFLRDEAASTLSSASSANQLINMISLLAGKRIEPRKTLVFFDEVQESPNIVTLSKYLVQDGRFDIIMSGSLLGIEMSHARSLPVGYLRTETMFPLTFREFCAAQNVPDAVWGEVETCFREKRPVNGGFHENLIRLFRLYLVVGGMPEAVRTFVTESGDLGAVREVHRQLLALYREDIAKHAGNRSPQVKAIFDALPSQLDKENKRFQIKALNDKAKYDRYANDFAWLVCANAALKTLNVTDPRPMLERSEEQNRFKLYQSDMGMLMSQYRSNVSLAALAGEPSVNFGGVYENFVAQELAAAGVPLHYYHTSRKGEVDFIVETDEGKALPVEVKSGKDYHRHTALNNLLNTTEYGIDRAYVLTEAHVSTEARGSATVYYLPLYMMPFIAQEAKGSDLRGTKVLPPSW